MVKYEFTEEQNSLFRELSGYMIIASLLFIILGMVSFLYVLIVEGNIFFIVFGIAMLLLGIAFFIPTDNFRNIAETKGSDIAELIQAFTEIRSVWTLLIVVLIVHRLNVILQFLLSLFN